MAGRPSRTVWQGRSWRLKLVQQPLFDGTTQETGFIDHPGSVVIVPLMGKHVLMLRQYRVALDETILELPAGTRGWDEDWLACAQRELREETGYRANTWKSLGKIWLAPGITNELMAVYLAADLAPDPLTGDPDEVIEVQQLPLKDLVQMASDGRLQDAKSIVGLHLAAVHLAAITADKAR